MKSFDSKKREHGYVVFTGAVLLALMLGLIEVWVYYGLLGVLHYLLVTTIIFVAMGLAVT